MSSAALCLACGGQRKKPRLSCVCRCGRDPEKGLRVGSVQSPQDHPTLVEGARIGCPAEPPSGCSPPVGAGRLCSGMGDTDPSDDKSVERRWRTSVDMPLMRRQGRFSRGR